jgi:hypothetical protein
MKIKMIDKAIYRQHLNRVIIVFILSFTGLAILFGQLLLSIFIDTVNTTAIVVSDNESIQPESHLPYNAVGVFIALILCTLTINSLKATVYFSEITYVWQMKQLHNAIYRRLPKIKAAAEQGQQNAFIILTYYYQTLEQIYLLDDNTLTMNELKKNQTKLVTQIQQKKLTITAEQFDKSMVLAY